MQLKYYVPFKAQEGVDGQFALKEKLLNIEGIAIDTSVNLNKWQVPAEDLDYFVSTLIGAQLRIDHAESAMAVIGRVPEGKRVGNAVAFRAEVGDEAIIQKIIRGYLTHVSVQVDSDATECSKCQRPTRKEGVLVHLCPGAWEVVHHPKVRELSIVASPAYANTSFAPLGFAAAMNEDQWGAVLNRVQATEKYPVSLDPTSTESQLLNGNKNVGSKGDLQEPENKTENTVEREVKPLSEQKGQQAASSHTAQGPIVNVGPGESAPKQVDYAPFLQQLQDLQNQITQAEGAEADAEIDTLKKQIAKLESDIAKKATKRTLSKKISELSKKIGEAAEEGEEGEQNGQDGDNEENGDQDETSEEAKVKGHASGKGIVAVEALDKNQLQSPNFDWFNKDLLRAHRQLVGMK